MNDIQLLERAIELSGLSSRRFAVEILDVDERTVRYWLKGEYPLPGSVRILCALIVVRGPRFIRWVNECREMLATGRAKAKVAV